VTIAVFSPVDLRARSVAVVTFAGVVGGVVGPLAPGSGIPSA
jgi:hypothetical protein